MNPVKHTLPDGREMLIVPLPNVQLEMKVHSGYLVLGVNAADVEGKIKKIQRGDNRGFVVLKDGPWQIIGVTDQMSEEDRTLLIECKKRYIPGGYGIYYKNYQTGEMSFDYPKQGFNSLLQSLGLDPAKRYVLLKHE